MNELTDEDSMLEKAHKRDIEREMKNKNRY